MPNSAKDAPALEILDLTGKVLTMAWDAVKWVCYVRDFPASSSDQSNPERFCTSGSSVRPRTAGLWLRLTLTDGDELEGLAANDRSLVEGAGLMLTPPDTRSNTQRIYVPDKRFRTRSCEPDRRRSTAAGRSGGAAGTVSQPTRHGVRVL